MSLHLLAILLLPLLGFVINGLGFRRLSKGLAGGVGVGMVALSFAIVLGVWSLFLAGGSVPIHISFFDWIAVPGLPIHFSVLVDQLTLVMLAMVTGIGTLIHIYSASYMSHDEGFGKFFAYLNLFIFMMLLLVMGGNYLVMFIGWEGVGLCSYLLIGFWNRNKDYNNAARKAFVMNRIGDLGLLLGIFLIGIEFGTIEFSELMPLVKARFAENDPLLLAICGCLFVGAMGKSAQIPLYTWLPDAMAGPTPVSALIHAATMVTAGIYLIIRSSALYAAAPAALEVICYIGAATALLGALIGLAQNDIKKVLAYSTVSQLGYMFMALGVGAFSTSLFHVVTHAFFKALLFLGAGSVIHAMSNEQDLRKMGGLRTALPITFFTMLIGTLAISGIPPFAGFFSKDEILFHLYEHEPLAWAMGLVGSGLTAFYMFRLLYLTFFGSFRGTEHQKTHLHESPAAMTAPLMVLALLSTLGGLLNVPPGLGGTEYLAHWLAPVTAQAHGEVADAAAHATLEYTLMLVSVAVAIVGIIGASLVYLRGKAIPAPDEAPRSLAAQTIYGKFYIDEFYNALVVRTTTFFSRLLGVLDYIIVDLVVMIVARSFSWVGRGLRYSQSGSIGGYLLAMVSFIALYLIFLFKDNLF